MSRPHELEHLNQAGAACGLRVVRDGAAFAVLAPGGVRVEASTLAAAGLIVGAAMMASAELAAASAVALARYRSQPGQEGKA